MQKIILVSAFHLLLMGLSLKAQVCQSLYLGSDADTSFYFSLDSGLVKSQLNNQWDLRMNYFDYTIEVNETKGLKCWVNLNVDNANTTQGTDNSSYDPTDMDTAGLSTLTNGWTQLHNNYHDKTLGGAMNQNISVPAKGGLQEFGHSFYAFVPTYNPLHAIRGYRVYLLQLPSGEFKQFYPLISLSSTGQQFGIADLNGSNEQTLVFDRNNYTDQRFAYFDFAPDSIRIPGFGAVKANYDLEFTRYYNLDSNRYEIGILANENVGLQRVDNTPYQQVTFGGAYDMDDAGIIASTWMNRDTNGMVELVQDRNYLLQTVNGNEFLLYICGFDENMNRVDFRIITRSDIEGGVPCVADFSSQYPQVCRNDTVVITNMSSDANDYEWLTPGATIIDQDSSQLVVRYNIPGDKSVGLIARNINAQGDTLSVDTLFITDFLLVQPSVIPGFGFTLNGADVQVSDASLYASQWTYDFGDGTILTAQNPSHAYLANGTYSILQTVENACGTDTTIREVEIKGLGLSVNSFLEKLSFYPNPATDIIKVSQTVEELLLHNLQGQIVQAIQNGDTIKVNGLPSGTYFLVVKYQSGEKSFKVNIQ